MKVGDKVRSFDFPTRTDHYFDGVIIGECDNHWTIKAFAKKNGSQLEKLDETIIAAKKDIMFQTMSVFKAQVVPIEDAKKVESIKQYGTVVLPE